jgi:ethanolamine ammonia-lyase small subunit
MTDPAITASPWDEWRASTPARIALGRVGAGMPTEEVLGFGSAHAMARDAVHAALDVQALETQLRRQKWDVMHVRSQAANRSIYLRRPDLGRLLDPADATRLRDMARPPCDLSLVIGDGLSALAASRHAVPFLAALRPLLVPGLRLAPIAIAQQARVALADQVADLMGARLGIILIGERPGLSSPDSLGIYLTHAPFEGRADADRNCISNVRPEGLNYGSAAFKLAWLIRESLARGVTGIDLKDDSDRLALPDHGTAAIAPAEHP